MLIVYDPEQGTLTRGQLVRTGCYAHGETIANILAPYPEFREDFNHSGIEEGARCTDPYEIESDAHSPRTKEGMAEIWDERRHRAGQVVETKWRHRVMESQELTVDGNEFTLSADVGHLLEKHGAGVFTVIMLANLEGIKDEEKKKPAIMEYSIFHGVSVPGTDTQTAALTGKDS